MDDLKKSAQKLANGINDAFLKLDIAGGQKKLGQLRQQINNPNFWNDPQKAQEVSREEASLSKHLEPWIKLQKEANELLELTKLNDSSMLAEIKDHSRTLQEDFDALKQELKFQGEYDSHNVIIGIYAGAGGTDAQDWAQMLLRMYLRWAEAKGYKTAVVEQSAGDEAGIKSTLFEITGGSFLFGKLAGESGVHRLVRLSPFNADNLRQTSFAKVDVLPKIDSPSELVIDDKEIKIDVYRAGGHGGQSVNTTDSAVRVTHLPTGISVAIQNERSQLQNKETALTVLRSRLAQLQTQQHADTLSQLKGPNQSAEWGNQIRNYVLHPYKQVKDLRTGLETSDPDKVLDGNIDSFIDAWLEHHIS